MTNPNPHTHGGQQGRTQSGEADSEETKVGNNSMDARKDSGKTEQRSGEDFSEKDEQQKGDPDNPSETTGGSESGGEDKGAKR
jgi:hypothetical protein